MNQIYKVIWSRVKRCYVVVSEIAGRCGKNGGVASEKKSMPVRAFLCALAVTGCLLPGMAEAKTEYGPGASATGTASVAVGDDAKAAAVNSSAYGLKSKALSSHSVAIGNEASVGKGDPDPESSQNGIAIGHGANVTVNPATATPGITDKSGGIAIGHNATTKDINTVALGTGTVGQGAQAVAIGRNAHTDGNNTVAIGNNTWVRSTNGFALGNEARAGIDEAGNIIGKDNDQAFGSNARAWGGSSMAFGNNAKAANGGAIAMGNGSQSRGDWGVAIGNGAKALADGARALGANSTAKGVNSTAIGWDSKSEADRGIAIGETASVEDGTEHGIAIGTGAKASGNGSTGTPSLPASTVAIGQGAQALEVLRGLVFAPVMHAVQAGVSERLLALLNGGAVPEVKSAVIANAQSKVLIVEFHRPIAARVLEEAQKRGALPYPVGAESKYEIPPLFYRLSGTFRQANPQSEHCAIRINPNRSGEETVLRILRESIASI